MTQAAETAGNPAETDCELQEDMPLWAAHLDEQLHEIRAFIAKWSPMLAAFSGNGVMRYLGRGQRNAVREDRP